MSETSDLNGWKQTLNAASMIASMSTPKIMGAINATTSDELGIRYMPIAATMAPAKINGRRRPNRFHVRSEDAPTMG